MLTLADCMAPHSKTDHFIDEALRDLVEVDEEATSICENVKRLVKILSMVNFVDELDDDAGDAVNLTLLTHEIDPVVEGFGHLKH